MTEHAEIAGFLQVKFLYGEANINKWLQDNADLEIVEMNPLLTAEDDGILIVYRHDL